MGASNETPVPEAVDEDEDDDEDEDEDETCNVESVLVDVVFSLMVAGTFGGETDLDAFSPLKNSTSNR